MLGQSWAGVDEEEETIRRTTHIVADATRTLRALGLVGIADDAAISSISTQSRRELLMFLSELEEVVRLMQGFADRLAANISQHDRSRDAVAAYAQMGAARRQYGRRRGH